MAVAAYEQFTQFSPEGFGSDVLPPTGYRLVDSIPEVATERESVRTEAWALMNQRRLEVPPGVEAHQVFLPIDALSRGHKVLEAERIFGRGSPEHLEQLQGLLLDCGRLMAEWYRKKKPEYYAPLRHIFDESADAYFSHGLSIRQMTENALVPISNDSEEEGRRVNERVEDATPQILRRTLGKAALHGQVIRTASECTDKAIADHAEDQAYNRQAEKLRLETRHRGYSGYVPEIEKVMIRDIRLDEHSNDRFEEQIGLPGRYINHYVFQVALARRGVDVAYMDKTALHGAQILANDDLMDFVELLDTVASEEWCTEIFMGEAVPTGTVKDYAGFREEALRRQESLKDLTQTVATFVLDLEEEGVDRRLAPAMVEEFVKKLLLDLGKSDVVIAEQMFDAKTAKDLQEVARLESIGRPQQASELMQRVEKAAPGGGYCSGGSCGLETVDTSSESGKDMAEGVRAEPGDTVVLLGRPVDLARAEKRLLEEA